MKLKDYLEAKNEWLYKDGDNSIYHFKLVAFNGSKNKSLDDTESFYEENFTGTFIEAKARTNNILKDKKCCYVDIKNLDLEKPYEMDVYEDDKDFVRLTKKNVDIVNLIIKFDSAYRLAEADDYQGNTKSMFKNKSIFLPIEDIEQIVKRIDKENSTHLNSMGPKHKGDNTGIEKTVNWICNHIDFVRKNITSDSIEDHDEIVRSIATATEIKNNFSFATKFCCYTAGFGLKKPDHFSIYDSIVSQMIPYYYSRFCKKILSKTDMKNIKEKYNYKDYQTMIDEIIKKSAEVEGYKIGRRDFDHLIWYYYKGDSRIIDKSFKRIKGLLNK